MTLTPEQIADGWIEHDGGECPVPLDSRPKILWGDGWITKSDKVPAGDWDDSWRHCGPIKHHIIAYKPELTQ